LNRWEGCVLGRERCSADDPCAAHDRWADLRDAYLKLLAETTLGDVTRKQTKGSPISRPPSIGNSVE
jgi:DNA-binding IscR family transcriptional regulator